MSKPKLLLHSCCAPCSSSVLEQLQNNYDITIFYFNPNIFPETEYQKRLLEQKNFLQKLNIPLIVGNYNPQEYKTAICGHEHEGERTQRCYNCYAFRLIKTQELAEKLGFEFFTTTLSVSPHKNADWINQIGENLSSKACKFLSANFKKQNGYLRSLQISKQEGFYRQAYCGCEMSMLSMQNKLDKTPKL